VVAPPHPVVHSPQQIPPVQLLQPSAPSYTIPNETWIPLDRWVRVNHAGMVTNLPSSSAVSRTFGLLTPGGAMVIRSGSVLSEWRGLQVRLGFAPQLVGNQLFIHTLDLQKNIIPLISPAPAFAPRSVVIDAGHGGKDSGTLSALPGKMEKDYALDWAKRLGSLMAAAGWQVFFTRTNDTYLTLLERVEFAEQLRADLFLSLHFNATGGREHSGVETYCLTPRGMQSSVTRDYEDNASLFFPNNRFDSQNLQFAVRVHREVVAAAGSQDRGVRRARFQTVLRGQNRPAVLIEGGYLSNPREAALINTPEHRQKLAEAVARALLQ
jgi:N-acetylmuramoyl-L-alanine amidase